MVFPRSRAPNCGSANTMSGQNVAMQCHPTVPATWRANMIMPGALGMRLSTGFRLQLHCDHIIAFICAPQMKTLLYLNPALPGFCDNPWGEYCASGHAWKRVPFKDFRQPLKSLQQPVSSASFSRRCLSSCICRVSNTPLPNSPINRYFCNVHNYHESD